MKFSTVSTWLQLPSWQPNHATYRIWLSDLIGLRGILILFNEQSCESIKYNFLQLNYWADLYVCWSACLARDRTTKCRVASKLTVHANYLSAIAFLSLLLPLHTSKEKGGNLFLFSSTSSSTFHLCFVDWPLPLFIFVMAKIMAISPDCWWCDMLRCMILQFSSNTLHSYCVCKCKTKFERGQESLRSEKCVLSFTQFYVLYNPSPLPFPI